MYGNRKSLFHTRNEERLDNLNSLLARNRHDPEVVAIYLLLRDESILFLLLFLGKVAEDSFAFRAVHELPCVLAEEYRNASLGEGDEDLVSLAFLFLNHSHELGIVPEYRHGKLVRPTLVLLLLLDLGVDPSRLLLFHSVTDLLCHV